MKKVGLVGWRGMVGSVLMQRMVEEAISPISIRCIFHLRWPAARRRCSAARKPLPLQDARHRCAEGVEIIITLPGRRLHQRSLPQAARHRLERHWIDAASALRMADDAVIILDPVNMNVIKDALAKGGATGSAATAPCR